MDDIHKNTLQTFSNIRPGVSTSSVELWRMQGKFTNTTPHNSRSGKTWSQIYTVLCWADDKGKNKPGTYILSCHSLEPKWSWRPRGYVRYPANEWCLRSKEICSGQRTPLHSGFLHKRTREQTRKFSDVQLIKSVTALCTGERGHKI